MANKTLIIVDFQNDFCPDGALQVTDGDKIIEPINHLIEYAPENNWLIVATRDWHPRETTHFAEFGGHWPVHCVQGTKGAEFHPGLNLDEETNLVFSKGQNGNEDAYSGFDGFIGWPTIGKSLEDYLKSKDVESVYICGLATDYCVKATTLDAVKKGFKTYLILDACRAVNVNPDDGDKAVQEMINAGVIITTSKEMLK